MKKPGATTKLVYVIVALAAVTTIAHADDGDELEYHVTVGVEATGGAGVLGGGFRGQALIGKSFGHGYVRPTIALGGLLGAGDLSVEDPRSLSGSLSLGMTTYGPQAQVGLKFANGGRVDSRIFGSFSVMHVAMDSRLMLDHVPGISNDDTRGLRASVGANWADHVVGNGTCGQEDNGGCGILGIFIPQQAELVWERDGGSSRMGINLSWGI